jgi:hydrogenase nickel incorporation protein HypB
MTARIVEVRRHVLRDNDVAAAALRDRFRAAGVTCVSLVSSPGAGKTALLEHTLTRLAGSHRVAALVGDLATDNDARRLARSGARVQQITTGTVCHLDAGMIAAALERWDLRALDFLFIENVGNLVCPASYDLGEDFRAVLLSVTEGEDKPLKYPTIFNTADIAVVTKADLAGVVGYQRDETRRSIDSVRPGLEVIETSARAADGLDRWLERLRELRNTKLSAPSSQLPAGS